MSLPGSSLVVLADPNVTYLLFLVGILGIVAEAHHPGTLVPGIAGAVALVLALIGFSVLAVNWIGVALILLAAALFVAEAHAPRFGMLAFGGLVAFVAGSWLLFLPPAGSARTPSSGPISAWLIALGALVLGAYFVIVLRVVLRARHLPYVTGVEAMLGQDGVATTDLALRGTVRVRGEEWSAVAAVDPIRAGEAVEVLGVEGLTLRVHRPYEWGKTSAASALLAQEAPGASGASGASEVPAQ